MPDEHIIKAFEKSMTDIADIKDFLEKLYAGDTLKQFYTQPVLSMLITACDYLAANINNLRSRYLIE